MKQLNVKPVELGALNVKCQIGARDACLTMGI